MNISSHRLNVIKNIGSENEARCLCIVTKRELKETGRGYDKHILAWLTKEDYDNIFKSKKETENYLIHLESFKNFFKSKKLKLTKFELDELIDNIIITTENFDNKGLDACKDAVEDFTNTEEYNVEIESPDIQLSKDELNASLDDISDDNIMQAILNEECN